MNSILARFPANVFRSRLCARHLTALLAAITFLGFAQQIRAVGLFWSGDGTNEGGSGTWETNNLHFGTSASGPFGTIWTNANTDDATFEAAAGTVTIGASGITLNGALTDNSGYIFTNGIMTLSTASTFGVASGKTNTLGCILGGSGGVLTMNGPGTLLLATNANTFTGGTMFNGGTIQLSAANGSFNNFGAATSKITFNADNVTLLCGVTKTCQQPVDQKGDLNVHLTGPGNMQFSLAGGGWTLFGNRKITVSEDSSGVFIMGGSISTLLSESGGSCSLTKEGPGLMTMQTENSITGGFIINAGSVRLNATTITAPFGTSASTLTLNGGTLTTSADRAVGTPVINPISISANSAVTTTSGSASGATANLNFSSANINATPGTTLTFRNDATATGGNGIFAPRFSGGPFVYAGKIAIVNGALGSVTLNLFNTTTNVQTFNDVISGTGAISRSASVGGTGGTTIMNAANSYSGGTTLNDGAITLGVDSAGTPPTITSGPIGTGTLTVSPGVNGAPKLFSPNGGTLGNAINLGNTTAPLVVSNGDTFLLSGLLTGAGRISKIGFGQLRLSPTGGNSTYSGGTSNVSGEIAFDSNSSGAGDTPAGGAAGIGPIYAFSGCAFAPLSRSRLVANSLLFRGTSCTVNGGSNLTFTGSVDLGGNNVALTVNNSGTNALIFNGALTNGGLTKVGPSTIMLNGTSTYTGPTAVNSGSLIVNGSLGATAVTVGASGMLGGNGTIGGAVTVNSGGIISGGRSAGKLTISNNLDLSAGGTNIWELAANSDVNAGTDFDQLAMTRGNLLLGGSSHLLIKFIGSATIPDNVTPFWQSAHSWTNIALSGTAANPGNSNFSAIDGTNGITSGTFATSTDGSGSVILYYTPSGSVPPPVISPIVGAGTGNAQISWSSVSGAHYTVQYKTNLSGANWSSLTGLTASGSSTTIIDSTTPIATQKFYRVISP